MPMSSKFLTESTDEKIVKIGQYLVKICTKNDSLVFWATLYVVALKMFPVKELFAPLTFNY